MSSAVSEEKAQGLSSGRLEALSDGIFAFAMTLLMLDLKLPDPKIVSPQLIWNLLISQGDAFFNFALSFVLLAMLWLVHNQHFHHIKKINSRLVWINIFLLMFIVLIPFSVSLMNDYPETGIAEGAFALNTLFIGVLYFLNWTYATQGRRLVDDEMADHHIEAGFKGSLVLPAVSVLAFILAFITPRWSPYSYLLIPVLKAGIKVETR